MKWKQYFSLLTVLLLLLSLLSGCGSSAPAADRNVEAERADAPMAQPEELANDVPSGGMPLPENRKWVVTVHMQAETEDLDTLLSSVLRQVEALGGYVEDQNVYNGTAYADRRYRNAGLIIRIPAEKTDEFTDQVAKSSNVVSNSKNLEDITLQYVDTETRLKALEVEEARLLELMEQAETMSDLLEIEKRLTDVRYEKENVASRMRTYDNQVNYATVYLDIEEVKEYTPVEEPTVWERISGGFLDSLRGVGEGFLDFLVWILANSPYLLIWAAVITAAVLLIRKWRKRRKLKKQKNPPETPDKKP